MLEARPDADVALRLPAGTSALGLAGGRDGVVHVPPKAAGGASPLVVLLHGAGSSGASVIGLLGGVADEHGVIVLAPDSRGATWDVIAGGFGPDVSFLDRALALLFASCPVDPARLVLAGFSDGASYALSLGLSAGDLFTHLVAFSPGFMAPLAPVGRPRLFVTHGVDDPVLPIDVCSRRIVPRLKRAGYHITYEEFDGGHAVPPELAHRALAWVAAGRHP